MSPDEKFAMFMSAIFALIGAIRWYVPCFRIRALACPPNVRLWLYVYPLVCAAILFFILISLAASDVVTSPLYISFYLLMGVGFVSVMAQGFGLLGLSLRRDALERGNRASAAALGGALIGLTFCFAGGNIGDGPGWWVVIFSGLLATLTWYAMWLVLQGVTNVGEHISVDRDLASGLRLAGYLAASGLILGRAVAGDWVSPEQTVADFLRMCWPAQILAAFAAVVELICRPTPRLPQPPASVFGVLPAATYIVVAIGWLVFVGTGN
jgi:hypothetical protein